MSRRRAVAVLAVACGFFAVVGAAQFAAWAERGAPGASGVNLRAIVDRPLDGEANDWYATVTDGARSGDGTHLRVEAESPGTQLVSRAVPVHPGRCYVVTARLAAPQGAEVVVLDELADDTLGVLRVAATPAVEEAGRTVYSDDERRLTVGLRLPAGGTADVESMSIAEGGTCG